MQLLDCDSLWHTCCGCIDLRCRVNAWTLLVLFVLAVVHAVAVM